MKKNKIKIFIRSLFYALLINVLFFILTFIKQTNYIYIIGISFILFITIAIENYFLYKHVIYQKSLQAWHENRIFVIYNILGMVAIGIISVIGSNQFINNGIIVLNIIFLTIYHYYIFNKMNHIHKAKSDYHQFMLNRSIELMILLYSFFTIIKAIMLFFDFFDISVILFIPSVFFVVLFYLLSEVYYHELQSQINNLMAILFALTLALLSYWLLSPAILISSALIMVLFYICFGFYFSIVHGKFSFSLFWELLAISTIASIFLTTLLK